MLRVLTILSLAIIGVSPAARGNDSPSRIIYDSLLAERVSDLSEAIQAGDPSEVQKARHLVNRAVDRCRIVYGESEGNALSEAAEVTTREALILLKNKVAPVKKSPPYVDQDQLPFSFSKSDCR